MVLTWCARENENFVEPAVKPLENPSEENNLLAIDQIDSLRVPPREFLDLYAQNDFYRRDPEAVSHSLRLVLCHYHGKKMLHPSAFSSTFLKKLLDQGSLRSFEVAFEDSEFFEFEDYSKVCAEALRMVKRDPDDERYRFVASLCRRLHSGIGRLSNEEVRTSALGRSSASFADLLIESIILPSSFRGWTTALTKPLTF